MKLTAKQKAFALEFIKTGDGKNSAIAAGYSPKTAKQMARQNLTKPYLKAFIDAKMKEMEDAKIADATEVLQFFSAVMRADKSVKDTVYIATAETIDEFQKPPDIKQRVAAGKEIIKRFPDVNDELQTAILQKARADARRANAEAEIAEAKVEDVRKGIRSTPVIFVNSEDEMKRYMEAHPDEFTNVGQ